MKKVSWNLEKAQLIKQARGIDLDRIAVMIEDEEILDIKKSPNRDHQDIFIVDYDGYIVCVPFVENEQEIFIKTAFRSRKLQKRLKKE